LYPGAFEGFFFTLFAIGVSAAETAIAIAIIINIYRNLQDINIDKANELRY
jgi:NADH-quinone oxidoreductase subunit K